jgi:hypothetical protein
MSIRKPEDTQNSSFYQITSIDEKSGKLKTRVVKVISSSSILPETIEKSLKEISSKFSEDGKDLKEKEITLSQDEHQSLSATIKDRFNKETCLISTNLNDSTNIKVKKMDLSLAPAKTWATKFSHDVKELHPQGGVALGLVIFLETLLFPLTLIGYSLFSLGHLIATKVAESSKASQAEKELQELLGPASFDQFLLSLKTIEKLEGRLGENTEMMRSLQSASLYGKMIQEAARGEKDVIQIKDQLEKALAESSEDAPVILPCGSFVGQDFIPALLLMYKEGEKIIVKKLSFSPSETFTLEKTQILTKYELPKKNLNELLNQIVKAQKASQSLSPEERKKMATAQKGLGLHPKVELPREYRSAIDIFFSTYAEPIELPEEEKPWAFASPSSDPLSLLSLFVRKPLLELQGKISLLEKQIEEKKGKKEDATEETTQIEEAKKALQTLAEQSPELADKGAVLHLYVAELTRRLCKYAHTLSDDVRDSLFVALEQRVSKLGRRWSKAYGDKIAEEFLQTVRTRIAREKGNVERSVALRRIVQRDEVYYETQRSHPTILIQRQEPLPTTHILAAAVEARSEQVEISFQGDPLSAILETSQDIREVFLQKTYDEEKVDKSLITLTDLVDKADQLVANNNFSDARLYVQELLDVLPSAGNQDLLKNLSDQQMKALLSQAQKLQELRLELELRLGIFTLSPKELIGVVNASLLTTAYINRRAKEISLKCINQIKEKLKTKPLSDTMKNLFCTPDDNPKADEDLEEAFLKTLASKSLNCHELIKLQNLKQSGEDPVQNAKTDQEITKKTEILKDYYESLQLSALTDDELTTLLLSLMPINKPISEAIELGKKLEQSPDVSIDLLDKQTAFQEVLKEQQDRHTKAKRNNNEEFSLSVHQTARSIDPSSLNDFISFLVHFRPSNFPLDPSLSTSENINKTMKEIVEKMPERPINEAPNTSLLQHLQREELLANCLLLPEACLHPPAEHMEGIKQNQKILSKQSVLANLSQSPGRMRISHAPSGIAGINPIELSCIQMGSQQLFYVPTTLSRDFSKSSFTKEDRIACFEHHLVELSGKRDACLVNLEGRQEDAKPNRHSFENYTYEARQSPLTTLPPAVEAQLACLETEDPSSVILTIHFLFDHQELLSNPTAIAKLEKILFRKDLLAQSLKQHKPAWEKILSLETITSFLDQSIKKDNPLAAIFLERLLSNIRTSDLNPRLEEIKKHYQDQFSKVIATTLKKMTDSESLLEQVDLTTRLIPLLDKEKIQSLSEEDLATLLYSWGRVTQHINPKVGLGHYFFAQEHMEKVVLSSIPEDKIQKVLNCLLEKEYGTTALPKGEWQKDTNTAYRYFVASDIPGKEAFSIDFKRGIFQSSTARETSSKTDLIPSITLKDPHYRQVFGDAALEGMMTLKGSSLHYIVQHQGIEYAVDVDASTKKVLMITRTIEGKTFTHQMAKVASDSSSFSAVVKEKGLWEDEQNQLYLFTGSISANPLLDKYTVKLSLDKKGKIKEGITLYGKHLFIDSTKALDNLFPALKGQNLLFFSSERGGKVDEVVLVDDALSLKRDGIDWVPSFKEKGWRVATQSLAGFYKRYGMKADQVILPLENMATNEIEYVIFTKRLHVSRVKKGKPTLTVDTSSDTKRLSLAVDDRKNLSGSHASFLYMAMVCYTQGDLSQASSLIQKMSSERALTKAEELPLLLDLERQLEALPAFSDKAAAFLLKASLTLARIKKEQYHHRDSSLEPSTEALDRTQRIITLFQRYEKAVNTVEKENALKQENLTLTKNECKELDLFRQQSLHTILEIQTTATPSDIQIKRPNNVDELFFLYLLTTTTSENKKVPELTAQYDISFSLMQNFWYHLENIQKKKFKAQNLIALLQPFPSTQEPGLDASNDMARRFLMTFAKLLETNPSFTLDLPSSKELKTLENILKKTSTLSKKDQDELQEISDKMKASLEKLVSNAKTILRDEPLLKIESPSSKGSIDISTLELKLLQSPVLSDEEKTLYHKALESLGSSDPKKSAPLIDWLQTLHEMKVEIVAKRAREERDQQIARLETSARQSEPPSFTEVKLQKTIAALQLIVSSEELRIEFCSDSIGSLSQHNVEYLKKLSKEALDKLKLDVIKILGLPSLEDAQKIALSYQDPIQKKFLRIVLLNMPVAGPLSENEIQNVNKETPLTIIDKVFEMDRAARDLAEDPISEVTKKASLALDQSCKSPSSRMTRELGRIKKGMEEAEREASLGVHSVIPLTSLEPLEKRLTEDLRTVRKQCNELRRDVISMVRPYSIDLGLFGPFSKPDAYYEEEVITLLLDLYEDGRLDLYKDGRPESLKKLQQDVEENITTYLLLSTKKHLLEKAFQDQIGSISHLKSLQADITSSKEAIPAQLHLEWNAAYRELFKKIDRGYDLNFFSDDSLTLKDQALSRAALVFGYKQKIGVTKEQLDMIKKILDNPHALEELRMGLGKSFVISPLVARLLAKQGALPVIIFTEELIEQSRKDLDKRAFVFNFKRNPTLSSTRLAEEYQTLLEIKQSGKYVVTTISRLAALENKFHEMQDVLKQKNDAAMACYQKKEEASESLKQQADAAYDKALAELLEVQNQLSYLQKIYLFFDNTKHGTRFFVDEVDSILNISSEINYADGLPSKADSTIFDACKRIFDHIFSSTNPKVKVLANALVQNKQASMGEEALQKALDALAEEMTKEMPSSIQTEGLAPFLSQTSAKRPSRLEKWDEKDPIQKKIATIRHVLTKTLPTICSKQYGIDFGLADNGYTIVPMEGGRVKASTMFGEEAELIGYHLIGYMQDGCKNKEIFSNVLSLIQARADAGESQWHEFLQTFQGTPKEEDHQKLFDKLQAKTLEAQAWRRQFLTFLFLHTYHIEINKKQIPLLVQNIIGTRSFSGASGTMNRDALPDSFSKEEAQQASRKISGDMLFRLAAMEEGLSTKAFVFTDPLIQMQELLKDPSCKAIINIGAPFVGKTTIDVIRDLRQSADGRQKQFIFIHPTEKIAYFWDSAQENPTAFDKERDATKIDPKRCVYYFSPADTRGTDFKIPSGYGAVIPGATTTLSEMEQAVWRLRKLGMGQDAKFFIEEGLAKRIRSTTKKEESADVTVADLFVDMIHHTLEAEGSANLKLQMVQPSSITTKHIKDTLLRHAGSGSLSPFAVEKKYKNDHKVFFNEAAADTEIYNLLKGYFRREQTVNLQADYEPSDQSQTSTFLNKIYEAEIVKVKKLQAAISITPSPLSRLMQEALQAALLELQSKKDILAKERERFSSTLPETVRSSASVDEGAQCQIEQQQQQTTTVLPKKLSIEEAEEGSNGMLRSYDHFNDESKIYWKQFVYAEFIDALKEAAPDQRQMKNVNLMKDTLFSSFDPLLKGADQVFFISSSLTQVLSTVGAEGNISPCLVTLPFKAVFLCSSEEAQSFLYEKKTDAESYFPDPSNIYVISTSSDAVIPLLPQTPPFPKSLDFMIGISKLIMGIDHFNEKEMDALKDAFISQSKEKRDSIISTVQKRGKLSLSEKLENWNIETPPSTTETEEEFKIFPSTSLISDLDQLIENFQNGESYETADLQKIQNYFNALDETQVKEFCDKMNTDPSNLNVAIITLWNDLRKAQTSDGVELIEMPSNEEEEGVDPKDTVIDNIITANLNQLPPGVKPLIEAALGLDLDKFKTMTKDAKFTAVEKKQIQDWMNVNGISVDDIKQQWSNATFLGKLPIASKTITSANKKIIPTLKKYLEGTPPKGMRQFYLDQVAPPEKKKPAAQSRKPDPEALKKAQALLTASSSAATTLGVPVEGMVIDRGGGGDCAALSLLDQLKQREDSRFTGQQALRNLAKEQLEEFARTFTETITQFGNDAQFFLASEHPDAVLFKDIIASLQASEDAGVLQPNDIRALDAYQHLQRNAGAGDIVSLSKSLVESYASLVAKPGFWLDKGFFAILATHFQRQIVILRPTDTDPRLLKIEERFSQGPIDPDKALFIYYNGQRVGRQGYHYQSINLDRRDELLQLIAIDKKERIKEFCHSMNEQIQLGSSLDDKRAGFRKYLSDLKTCAPDAYRAFLSLAREKLGLETDEARELNDLQIDQFSTLGFSITIEEMEAKITPSPIRETANPPATPSPAKEEPQKPAEQQPSLLTKWLEWLFKK